MKCDPRNHCSVYVSMLLWQSSSHIIFLHNERLGSLTCTTPFQSQYAEFSYFQHSHSLVTKTIELTGQHSVAAFLPQMVSGKKKHWLCHQNTVFYWEAQSLTWVEDNWHRLLPTHSYSSSTHTLMALAHLDDITRTMCATIPPKKKKKLLIRSEFNWGAWDMPWMDGFSDHVFISNSLNFLMCWTRTSSVLAKMHN